MAAILIASAPLRRALGQLSRRSFPGFGPIWSHEVRTELFGRPDNEIRRPIILRAGRKSI
jgi:hypothetical protein